MQQRCGWGCVAYVADELGDIHGAAQSIGDLTCGRRNRRQRRAVSEATFDWRRTEESEEEWSEWLTSSIHCSASRDGGEDTIRSIHC